MSSNRRFSGLTRPALIAAAGLLAAPVFLQHASAQATVEAPRPAAPAKTDVKEAPPPPPETPGQVATMTIASERPTNRIDRQVYDLKSDISTANASLGEALNNIPSVAVDPDGGVTLRGSPSVQILIDGKPSAMMQGDNRAAALAAIPADDIESIEVITNPGAQFGNDGGTMIINIIMKRVRRPGGFGVVNANGGTAGRKNSSFPVSYNDGRTSYQGGMNVRHDGRAWNVRSRRERIDETTGAITSSDQAYAGEDSNDSFGINGAITYNLGESDTLLTNASFSARRNDQDNWGLFRTLGPGGFLDAPSSAYWRTTGRAAEGRNYAWTGRFTRKGPVEGELLRMDLRLSGSNGRSDTDTRNDYSVSGYGPHSTASRQFGTNATRIADFTGDYELPREQAMLKLGFKLTNTRNSFNNEFYSVDPLAGTEALNTNRTNRYDIDELNLALYGSHQMKLDEKWTAQAGLRLENQQMTLHQLTSQLESGKTTLSAIPSAFATYKTEGGANIRLSYSHRIRRPTAGDLNPFVVYRDEQNVSSGNPKLKPAQTDSFEAGYETKLGQLDTTVRGYFRKEQDVIANRSYFISDTVLLTTRENLTGNRSGGVEFIVGGKLTPALTVNGSGNLGRFEQTSITASGLATTRNTTSLSLQGRVNYQATPADQLQASVQLRGRSLWGQGFREPYSMLNLSYRRNLTPALALVVNASDVLRKNAVETYTDLPTLREWGVRRFDSRVMYVGLSYRFFSDLKPAGR